MSVLIPEVITWRAERAAEISARVNERKQGAPWRNTDMITVERAENLTRQLFPDDYSDGIDCHDAADHPGEPCPLCRLRWFAWRAKVDEVRKALIATFA